ncbi:acyl dehydratase [Saccharothrix tamanrassetensis]|uniref:Acyl dehydratase n=1 Tax=Saccharothrix tamanrassetensis TaxID=1051531 RepID=A0A841CM25_9PSEU|nr:MaoC/PaaZ C-terminal domain-containing protein [Saccharothrix tamanrassetensis]MBB5959522.1 acyl dehydratase [Saccharothrix tamanrassetensis]
MRYFEDFRIGDVHELGDHRISGDEIRAFAHQYDPQPIHLGRSGEPIASGWHVAATFMRLYVDSVVNGAAAEVSPGIDELRWLRPVRPGDLLVGRMTVLGTSPSLSRPDCGIVRQRGELVDAAGRPVMRFVFHGLMRRRSAEPGSAESRPVEPHLVEPRPVEARSTESSDADSEPADSGPTDSQPADSDPAGVGGARPDTLGA